MNKIIQGNLSGKGKKYAVIAGRFNDFISEKLVGGAMDAFTRCGVEEDDVDIIKVPGAFEIPLAAKMAASTKKYDGIVCVGAVIRGATPHFDYVCAEVSKGIAKLTLDLNLPIMFGVLTTNTIEQAIERAGTKAGNKGFDAALSCIEMVNLMEEIS